MTFVVNSQWPLEELLRSSFPDGSSGRMSLECFPATTDETSWPSNARWSNWGIASPTGFWTHPASELPRNAVESSLSDALDPIGEVPQRCYLSADLCLEILQRAEARNKEMPDLLRNALNKVARLSHSNPETSGAEQEHLPL